jgi:hypothetical protein
MEARATGGPVACLPGGSPVEIAGHPGGVYVPPRVWIGLPGDSGLEYRVPPGKGKTVSPRIHVVQCLVGRVSSVPS